MTDPHPSSIPFPGRDRISLCMIVKNESRSLARCLRSAAPWVGEIVVVDTGSTDDTVAIAESFGARVFHFPWCDDFSAARNESLDRATREWALVLDADEELVMVNPDEASRAVVQDALDGFSFRVHNRLDSGETSFATVFRLFRRTKPGMRYQGAIHEQIQAVSEGRARTAALGCLYLTHDGYTAAVVEDKGKADRNVTLSKKLVDERPGDPFAWYALGLSYQAVNVPEAIRAYEKTLTLLAEAGRSGEGEAYVLNAHQTLVKAYYTERDLGRARTAADRGLAVFPDSPDLRYARAQLRLQANDFTGAAEDLEACLRPEAQAQPLIDTPGAAGYAARAYLGLAYTELGRHAEGEACLRQAIAESPPGFVVPHAVWGARLLERGDWAEAQPLLAAAHQAAPGDADVRFKLGWCLFHLERFEEAEEVLQPLSGMPHAQQLLGQVLLEAGQAGRALEPLKACPLPSAGLARGWALYLTEQPQAASEAWNDWLRAGAADWGTKDTLAKFLFLLMGGSRPTTQPERPAEPLRDMDRWFRLLLRHHRFDEVQAVIERGPELGERLWRPLRKRWGITLLKEGFRDVGTMLLLQAQQDDPEDADVYYWLGVSSLEQREVDDAKTLWETALRIAPGHPLASQSLSLLRN